MSDVAQGSDWWLASDGKWYPPTSRPPPPSTATAPARAGMPAGLTTAASLTFWLVALLCLITGLLRFDEASKFQAWRDSGFGDRRTSRALDSAESASFTAFNLALWAGLAALVLTIIWSYRATLAARRFGASGMSWSPGWAVGGWFIPVGNAVIPKLMLHEVERVSSPDSGGYPVGERWRTSKIRADGWVWWMCLLVGSVMVWVGSVMTDHGYPTAASFEAAEYRRGLYTFGLGFVVLAVSAAAGALTIMRLGKQLNRSLDVATSEDPADLASPTP